MKKPSTSHAGNFIFPTRWHRGTVTASEKNHLDLLECCYVCDMDTQPAENGQPAVLFIWRGNKVYLSPMSSHSWQNKEYLTGKWKQELSRSGVFSWFSSLWHGIEATIIILRNTLPPQPSSDGELCNVIFKVLCMLHCAAIEKCQRCDLENKEAASPKQHPNPGI